MANRDAILDKIRRNLEMLDITIDADTVSNGQRKLEAGNVKIQYADADISSPMGGVSDSSSPFLGIGIANPGSLILSGLLDADTTIASVLADETDLRVLRVCSGMANDITIKAGRTDDSVLAADLATMPGSSDVKGLGQ